jgi:hypothetical protein
MVPSWLWWWRPFSDAWADAVADEAPPSLEECEAERVALDACLPSFGVHDLTRLGAGAHYPKGKSRHSGKNKRTYRPRVDLKTRRIVAMVHQTGFERSEARTEQTAHRITAHTVVSPAGERYRVHPLTTSLVAGNRIDRKPWHGLHIEVCGNFERIDGTGTWWAPDRMGRGRASDAQVAAVRAEIRDWDDQLRRQFGVELYGAAPHVITGQDRRGHPNRQACCGSRLHSECVEWAGAEMGLRVPGPGFALGGAPVDPSWHGEYWPGCSNFLDS